MAETDLVDVDRFHRFVLLAVADLTVRDDPPVHSFDVTALCEELLDEFAQLDELFSGGVTRNRVITALNELEADDLLETGRTRSATGKGRPAYSLAVDVEHVLDRLEPNEAFTPAVEHVRDEWE